MSRRTSRIFSQLASEDIRFFERLERSNHCAVRNTVCDLFFRLVGFASLELRSKYISLRRSKMNNPAARAQNNSAGAPRVAPRPPVFFSSRKRKIAAKERKREKGKTARRVVRKNRRLNLRLAKYPRSTAEREKRGRKRDGGAERADRVGRGGRRVGRVDGSERVEGCDKFQIRKLMPRGTIFRCVHDGDAVRREYALHTERNIIRHYK